MLQKLKTDTEQQYNLCTTNMSELNAHIDEQRDKYGNILIA